MNKQKSQSGFAHLIIVLILAAGLIGALGFIYWQNFMQPKISVSKTDNEKIVNEVKSKAAVDQMADWKTYNNAKYGFSFKYPVDWIAQETPTANGNSFPSPLPDILVKSPTGDDLRVWVNIENGWGYEIDNFNQVVYVSKVSTSGVALSERTFIEGQTMQDFHGYQISINFDYNNNKFVLMGTGSDKTKLEANEAIIVKIMSTWKFN